MGLHPQAAPWNDRAADGRRCGNCAFRRSINAGSRSYPKCTYGDGVRMSHGVGTDVRAWWPACTEHEWGDNAVSDDAARWVPEPEQ